MGIEQMKADPTKVFVAFGRNIDARNAMFNFLRAIGLNPRDLTDFIKDTGKTVPFVGEILDKAFSIAQAVVVLMTPDDIGCLKKKLKKDDDKSYEIEPTGQARLNVIFEAGMSIGKYESRTIIVELGELRPFSDIAGRFTVRLDNTAAKRKDLVDRLRVAKCQVDDSGRDWLEIDFFKDIPNLSGTESSQVTTILSQSTEERTDEESKKYKLLLDMESRGLITLKDGKWAPSEKARKIYGKYFIKQIEQETELGGIESIEQAISTLIKQIMKEVSDCVTLLSQNRNNVVEIPTKTWFDIPFEESKHIFQNRNDWLCVIEFYDALSLRNKHLSQSLPLPLPWKLESENNEVLRLAQRAYTNVHWKEYKISSHSIK